jgi:predicted transcriptional regulator of viral defense system
VPPKDGSLETVGPVRPPPTAAPDFAFLTNHGKTLLLIAHDQRIRMRDIADRLHITERATQRIVGDLARAGYLERERDGRRNHYSVRSACCRRRRTTRRTASR